jgi:hypothetical protein
MRRGIAVGFGLGTAALVSFVVTLIAADAFIGTWKLDPSKSHYSPGNVPQSNTLKVEAVGTDGIKVTTDGVNAAGQKTHTEYSAKFDGKDAAITGNPNANIVSVKRIDDHSMETTFKKDGKVMVVAKTVVSKDGKTRTTTTTGIDAEGRTVHNVAVYEKQ